MEIYIKEDDNMFILQNISGVCSSPALASIISLIKRAMNIIWIVGPILAIVGAIIALIKLLTNPEEKKHKALFKNMIIALFLLFFIPAIVNAVMMLFDDTFEVSACWNAAEEISETTNQDSHYINPNDDRETSSVLTDPDKYTAGEKNSTTGTSNSSSSSSSSTSNSISKVIFVGDSRTVGMQQSVGNQGKSDVWSCKGAMGLDWMKSTGIPNIDSEVTSGSALVILMGVNDLYHVDSYISYLNGLVSSVKSRGAKMYFVSVNPTSGSASYLNEDIDSFNAKMKSKLSSYIEYIDTNTYLKKNGFSSGDGVHYSVTTYKNIYSYIKSNL